MKDYQIIFTGSHCLFESKKERNLYCKFFAGYFFNELIPGYESRLANFTVLLQNPVYPKESFLPTNFALSASDTCVSFDNHPDIVTQAQYEEFADIIIYSSMKNVLVGIEVKYLDDWDFEKDIQQNTEKLVAVGKDLNLKTVIPCLLIARKKWERASSKQNCPGSNVKKLLDNKSRVIIIQWESFLMPDLNKDVYDYLKRQLEKV